MSEKIYPLRLSDYSTEAIIRELARSQIGRHRKPIVSCDECRLFRPWSGAGDPPASFNPCTKGHRMLFRMPRDGSIDEPSAPWGFYRRGCKDRIHQDEV